MYKLEIIAREEKEEKLTEIIEALDSIGYPAVESNNSLDHSVFPKALGEPLHRVKKKTGVIGTSDNNRVEGR